MGTSKLIDKLEHFFALSKKKQHKKREKLQEIVDKLQDKKDLLKQEIIVESEIDQTSSRYHGLCKQHKAISKLLKKARKQVQRLEEET